MQAGETPPTLEQLKERAAILNPLRPIPEVVRLKRQPMMGGGYRHVLAFGWRRRALQQICCDILAVTFPVQPFDFLAKGKGVDAATEHLKNLIEEYNAEFVVTIDIKDCFGSATKEKVAQLLPPPSWAVNNVLLIQDGVTVVAHPDWGDGKDGLSGYSSPPLPLVVQADDAARRGIPRVLRPPVLSCTGRRSDPCSVQLSSRIDLSSTGTILAVPVSDETEAEAVLKTLRSLLETSPVGPLLIGREVKPHITQGVDFLSYRIVKKAWYVGGHLHICPSAKGYKRVQERAARRFLEVGGGPEGP